MLYSQFTVRSLMFVHVCLAGASRFLLSMKQGLTLIVNKTLRVYFLGFIQLLNSITLLTLYILVLLVHPIMATESFD